MDSSVGLKSVGDHVLDEVTMASEASIIVETAWGRKP